MLVSWRQRYRRFVVKNSSQRNRRIAVLAYYFSAVLLLVALYTLDASLKYESSFYTFLYGTSAVISVAAIIAILPTHTFIRTSVQIAGSERDEDLDERQQVVRDRAYRSAYWMLAVTGLWAAIYVGYVHSWLVERWVWLEASDLLLLLAMGAALVVFTLPRAVMAWTEPDAEG